MRFRAPWAWYRPLRTSVALPSLSPLAGTPGDAETDTATVNVRFLTRIWHCRHRHAWGCRNGRRRAKHCRPHPGNDPIIPSFQDGTALPSWGNRLSPAAGMRGGEDAKLRRRMRNSGGGGETPAEEASDVHARLAAAGAARRCRRSAGKRRGCKTPAEEAKLRRRRRNSGGGGETPVEEAKLRLRRPNSG